MSTSEALASAPVTAATAGPQILTAENIPQYLQDNDDGDCWTQLQAQVPELQTVTLPNDLTVKPITGGNVNYAFCLEFAIPTTATTTKKKTVFLKQAPEFVAIFGPDGFPLTSQRMQREMNVYQEWKTLLQQSKTNKGETNDQALEYLPEIYYFDRARMAVFMEFLHGFQLLDHLLVAEPSTNAKDDGLPSITLFNSETVTKSLGDFMGRTHALTHALHLPSDRLEQLRTDFENREMRDIQLQFVFSKCYNEATEEQERLGFTLTTEFVHEIELLKQQYNGTYRYKDDNEFANLVLSHGDLHPGSVMVHPETRATKVIDPEFTVYGPPGLDVGSLLSGYILGAIHQAYAGHPDEAKAIVQGSQAIWNQYVQSFQTVLLETLKNNSSNRNDKDMPSSSWVTSTLIPRIAVETVGFAAAEVCRTALGFAGGRLWLQFEDDPAKKVASQTAALTLVQHCMVARHRGGVAGGSSDAMELLWKEMNQAITID